MSQTGKKAEADAHVSETDKKDQADAHNTMPNVMSESKKN